MKPVIFAIVLGTLLGACSYKSETTVQRPAAQPTAVIVADPAPTTTTTTVYRTN